MQVERNFIYKIKKFLLYIIVKFIMNILRILNPRVCHLDENLANLFSYELLVLASRCSFKTLESAVKIFDVAQPAGINFSAEHFYSPIPNKQEINDSVFTHRYDNIPGLELSEEQHIKILQELSPFCEELSGIQKRTDNILEFSWENPAFNRSDSIVLYCMVRTLKPKKIIEIGSGWTSLMSHNALLKNGSGELVCIEPYPMESTKELAKSSDRVTLINKKIQDIDMSIFSSLGKNDILFIDSSHVSKIGSDVNREFFEIIPFVKPGVVIHIHDMFFPYDYPKSWVMDRNIFWNEQYLLMAFLAFNDSFKIKFSNIYSGKELTRDYQKHLGYFLESLEAKSLIGGGSLWLERES